MTLVIDASVAMKWVVAEPGSDAADALLDQHLIAPDLWLIEAANALWAKVARAELTPPEAQARLRALERAPLLSVAARSLLSEALSLASELNHPVYDCVYLALGLRESAPVVTADRRLHAAACRSERIAPLVRLLSE